MARRFLTARKKLRPSPTPANLSMITREEFSRCVTRRKNVVSELRSLKRGRVRIGANESTSLYILPHLILEYREQHPNVKVEIFRQVSERLPREVLDRNVDFALLAFEPVDSDLESFPILQDELVLIMSPDDPLAKRESLKIEELGEQSFVAHNVKTASRHKVIETFEQHHTPLNITLELATVETIKRFVQLKIGLAFVPRMCVAEELERGTLATVPVPELSYFRTLWVTHRRNITLSHAAAAFLEVLRQRATAMPGTEGSQYRHLSKGNGAGILQDRTYGCSSCSS